MNQNSGKFNIPRLLNYYLDNIIKGKEKDIANEEEIDEVLQRIVNLFSYLQDKDEFFEYLRKSLCKRLLAKGKQYNENTEKSFLSRLKAQSGDAAIRKLQGMFTDVQDESLNENKQKFESWNGGNGKIGTVDLEVQVLNESHWPISGTQKFPLVLNRELADCQAKFQKFYDGTTEKRRMWLGSLPVGALARRYGRRFALQTGSVFGMASGLISYSAVMQRPVLAAARRHVLRRALRRRASIPTASPPPTPRARRSGRKSCPGFWPAACSPR